MATIEYSTKYANVIDEKFKTEAKSDQFINKDYDFVGVQSVKVYNISTAAMGDYTRSGLSRYGTPAELDATTQEMTMKKDRSFTFTIDKMNEDETAGALNAGKALARQIKEVVIPEVDTYRFTTMFASAGTKKVDADVTKENVYDLITTGTEVLDEKEVPQEGRQLLVTPGVYKAMKNSKDITMETEIGQEMRIRGVIALYDGMEVIKVPSSRLPANARFMISHKVATTAPVKLAEYKIHTDVPGISGSLVEGRVYYDAFILNNKKDAIYVYSKTV